MSPAEDDERTRFEPTALFPPAAPAPSPPAPLPMSASDSGNALPPGTYLGEFELLGVVGEGGFGIVYRAWDHTLKRQVAIKEYMPSSLAHRTNGLQVGVKSKRESEPFIAGLQSFVKEAQMLAQFDHPSLVKVYRFWEANGSAYMVMPFYEGKTLRDVLRSRREPPDEATLLSWIGPVADALAVIHAESYYHRDIAPDNVLMLGHSGRPLLLDFGAARRVIGDMTQNLTVILKPGYAPVEQYAEIPGMKQGPWTDVYALAAVAYYAVRGRTPPPSVGRLVNDSYEPLTRIAEGRYSERCLAAIDRALAVKPEQRTRSITEFKRDLGLAGPPVDFAPDSMAPDSGLFGASVPPDTEPAPFAPTEIVRRPPLQEVDIPTMVLPRHEPRTERVAPPAVPEGERTRVVAPPVAAMAAAPAAAVAAGPAAGSGAGSGAGKWIGIGVAVAVAIGAAGWFATRPQAPAAVPAAATPAGPAPTDTAAAPGAPPATAAAPATANTAAAPTPPFDVANEFARTVQAQTGGWGIDLALEKSPLRIDKDRLVFSVRSLQGGYVYVFNHSADGALQQLYPNALVPPPRVAKGGVLKLPAGGLNFDISGPEGTNRLLVLVSRLPREHSAFAPKEEGGFKSFPTGAAAADLAAKNATDRLPLIAGRPVCPATGACTDEFGAATVSFDVIR
jgi:serine/threonine protein kinase